MLFHTQIKPNKRSNRKLPLLPGSYQDGNAGQQHYLKSLEVHLLPLFPSKCELLFHMLRGHPKTKTFSEFKLLKKHNKISVKDISNTQETSMALSWIYLPSCHSNYIYLIRKWFYFLYFFFLILYQVFYNYCWTKQMWFAIVKKIVNI